MRQFSGQRAWLVQRLSAVVLLFAAAVAGVCIGISGPPDYRTWLAFVRHPAGCTLILAATAALCLHGWVGARDVVLDYIHRPAPRLAVLALVAGALALVFLRVAVTLAAALARAS
ncbi:succinate dehydrogenase, hydrophobic membrane anchor protein [Bordetella petrii]|nr:succinate dehydrogenase, hydrophobic membrane anchor protein [Bordetella petrii]